MVIIMEQRVVVTGMGAVTPIGNNVAEYWKALRTGKCGIDFITRFDTAEYKAKVAAEVKNFDPLMYMEKSEVRKNDLFAQYAMTAASQAIEESGIIGKVDPFQIGTYIGSGIGGISTFADEQTNLLQNGAKKVSPFFIPKLIANIAGGIIAIKYKLKGANLPVTTACATGNNAIGEAYRAIKHGYLQAAVAGGAEAAIVPVGVAGFSNMKALTTSEDPARASIPFDKERSGFVMGEGAGALVLESYESAVNRGATIYAELCGYGITCDAHHITAPSPDAEGGAAALKMAYDEAMALMPEGCAPEKIYINAHGTSTPANDRTETLAIKKALGEDMAAKLMVSSTKSMTGHMLGAAGAVEAIACVKAIAEGIVPPTIGYKETDPECDLDYVANTARKADIELGLSASLGFGGHNAYVAVKKFR
jgi:beta-ketoacyl-acyl-carrier-protein synthase II